MQYLVIGYDGTDENALERRMRARPAHMALADKLKAEGKMLYAVAILNDAQVMIGSAMICDFPSKEELDGYLKAEPYITGEVWRKVEVKPCKVGPTFAAPSLRGA